MVKIVIKKHDILFWFVLIDILFLPYIKLLRISASVVPLLLWYVKNLRKVRYINIFRSVIFLELAVIFSTLLGFILHPQAFSTNITYLITFTLTLSYYFFIYTYLTYNSVTLTNLLLSLICVSLFFALLFISNPSEYFSLRSIWSLNSQSITFVDALINRYTFIMSDPNSVGTILCSAMLLIFITETGMRTWKKIIIACMTFGTVVASISTTAFVVYVISLLMYWVTTFGKKIRKKFSVNGVIICIMLISVAFFYVQRVANNFNSIDIARVASERISGNIEGGTLSGRTQIWQSTIKDFSWYKYIILGHGSAIVDHFGTIRKPHNGHFYVILAFGVIAYVLFMKIFFKKPRHTKWKYYIAIIPLLMLFTVNTLLQDYRACLAFVVLIAYYQTWVIKMRTQSRINAIIFHKYNSSISQ